MHPPRLFVRNLPPDITEDVLRAAFAPWGQVTEVHVVLDRYTGRARGFAFVTMGTADQAKTAAEKLNGATVAGRAIKVSAAEPGGGRTRESA